MTITHQGPKITWYDGEPFDPEHFDGVSRRIEDLAKVVLLKDLAKQLNRDRSSFMRRVRREGFDIIKVLDPRTEQMANAVEVDQVSRIQALFEPEHDIVDPADVL